MALEQPEEVDYWRGVKFGLQAFFELTNNEAADYEALAAELTFNENTGANDGGEYDVSDAVSDIGMSLGSSPL
jgi:hypothetical protein